VEHAGGLLATVLIRGVGFAFGITFGPLFLNQFVADALSRIKIHGTSVLVPVLRVEPRRS